MQNSAKGIQMLTTEQQKLCTLSIQLSFNMFCPLDPLPRSPFSESFSLFLCQVVSDCLHAHPRSNTNRFNLPST